MIFGFRASAAWSAVRGASSRAARSRMVCFMLRCGEAALIKAFIRDILREAVMNLDPEIDIARSSISYHETHEIHEKESIYK